MMIKKLLSWTGIAFILSASVANAQDGVGQTVQIYTHFKRIVGSPTWLIILRDIDHNQNIPYVFPVNQGDNFWVALSYGRNYTIVASRMKMEKYHANSNRYSNNEIKNFCGLESNGRILHGESVYVTVEGDLTRNPDSYRCHISKYADSNFSLSSSDPN